MAGGNGKDAMEDLPGRWGMECNIEGEKGRWDKQHLGCSEKDFLLHTKHYKNQVLFRPQYTYNIRPDKL